MGPAEWIYGIFNFRYGDYVVGTKLDIVRSCSLNVHRSVDTHTHNHTHTHTYTHHTHTPTHTTHSPTHTHTHTHISGTSHSASHHDFLRLFTKDKSEKVEREWRFNITFRLRFFFLTFSSFSPRSATENILRC